MVAGRKTSTQPSRECKQWIGRRWFYKRNNHKTRCNWLVRRVINKFYCTLTWIFLSNCRPATLPWLGKNSTTWRRNDRKMWLYLPTKTILYWRTGSKPLKKSQYNNRSGTRQDPLTFHPIICEPLTEFISQNENDEPRIPQFFGLQQEKNKFGNNGFSRLKILPGHHPFPSRMSPFLPSKIVNL